MHQNQELEFEVQEMVNLIRFSPHKNQALLREEQHNMQTTQ
jgi:hypothetical protein